MRPTTYAETNARVDAAISRARQRIAASGDAMIVAKGTSTVCKVVDALKTKVAANRKAAATPKKKTSPTPNKKRKTSGTKARKKPSTPCADVSTPHKLLRCLSKCCDNSKRQGGVV